MSYLTDALGSTQALVDSSGTVQVSYEYEPFGAGFASTSSVNSTNSYAFTGREYESSNDALYYYRGRYYHPILQRFISQDPLDFAGGDSNLYAYVFNGPTNFTDPAGRIVPALLAAGGLLGGAAAAYSNYGAYRSGAITGQQYVKAIAFGSVTGVIAAIPTGILGSVVFGGLGAAANDLYDQHLRHPCGEFRKVEALEAGLIGAGGGFVAAGLGRLGEQLYGSIEPSIGQEVLEPEFQSGYPTPRYTTLGMPGGIVGNGLGTAAGAYLGPQ